MPMLGRIMLMTSACAAAAGAQVPGAPVLQNAFANPGWAVAANIGGGSGQTFYGLATAMGLMTGKLQLSGAAGVAHSNNASRGGYGARASFSAWSTSGGALGVGAFAGIGGAPRTRTNNVVTNPAELNVPAGLSIGYRHAFGSHGVSAYASPFYKWVRSDNGVVTSTGQFRGSLGVDVGLSTSLGLTLGGEMGGKSATGTGSSSFGAAISFVPGRR